jgi:hypothetical protein
MKMAQETKEKGVVCPTNLRWLKGMLSILPEELRGKLAPYSVCLVESPEETEEEKKTEEKKPETLEE